MVSLHLHSVVRIKLARSGRFFEDFVDCNFKIGVIGFKKVFEEESKKLACTEKVD